VISEFWEAIVIDEDVGGMVIYVCIRSVKFLYLRIERAFVSLVTPRWGPKRGNYDDFGVD
jgi:hypothetical protein